MRGIQRFERKREANLALIHDMLRDKTYVPSSYHEKIVYEPKKRTIYILPFMPDRVVHHALMNILEPIWTPLFITDTYACITGRGIHTGSRRTMEYVRRNAYCLKGDISKFYPSIRHDTLKSIIRKKIKCKDTLWLVDCIIDSFPGDTNVPIGNYTSQWFGNLYMNELDQYVKHELKIKDYIRYCDDFLLFHDDKKVLHDALNKVRQFVGQELHLTLSKDDIFPVSRGVDFLGYRHFRSHILLRKGTARRVARKIKSMMGMVERGAWTPEYCRSMLASAWGWLRWANTYNFQQNLDLINLTERVDELCRSTEVQ